MTNQPLPGNIIPKIQVSLCDVKRLIVHCEGRTSQTKFVGPQIRLRVRHEMAMSLLRLIPENCWHHLSYTHREGAFVVLSRMR